MNRRAVLAGALALVTLAAAAPASAQGVLTNADVVKMAKAGLSDEIMINSIKTQPAAFDLSPEAMIELKKSGVSDAVIAVMQQKASGAAPAAAGAGGGREIVLPDATEVTVRLLKTISSADARADDEVKFEVVEDVVVDGVVVIRKDAVARGRVLMAEHKKSFGRKGKLDFSIDTVEAVDGQKIRLRYTREERGKSKYGTAGVVTWVAGPFGFLVKGKDVEIPSGTEYTIFIDEQRTIRLKS